VLAVVLIGIFVLSGCWKVQAERPRLHRRRWRHNSFQV